MSAHTKPLILHPNRDAARPKTRVAVCIPAQDSVKTRFAGDLVKLMVWTATRHPEIELRNIMHRGTILPDQRNDLVHRAMEHEATHILWLDSDMRFPKETIVRLLAHREPIVAANYTTRRHPLKPVTMKRQEDGTYIELYTRPEDTGLVEAAFAGMGVMLVDMDVYRNLPQPWYTFWFNPKANKHVGEDVFFGFNAREAGLKVLIDQDLSKEVLHIGEQEYDSDAAIVVRDRIIEIAAQELVAS